MREQWRCAHGNKTTERDVDGINELCMQQLASLASHLHSSGKIGSIYSTFYQNNSIFMLGSNFFFAFIAAVLSFPSLNG